MRDLSIHEETSSTANLIVLPVKLDVDVKLKGFVSTFAVAYRVIDDEMISLDLLAGSSRARSANSSTGRTG